MKPTRAIAIAAAIWMIPATAAAQQKTTVRVHNYGAQDRQVAVYDRVCQRTLFRGRLVAQGMIPVSACRSESGHIRVTIYDHRGRSKAYDELAGAGFPQVGFFGSGFIGD